jgi:hypothetical protein
MGNPAGVRLDLVALEQRRREAAELSRQGIRHVEVTCRGTPSAGGRIGEGVGARWTAGAEAGRVGIESAFGPVCDTGEL